MTSSEFLGATTETWQAIGSMATAGAFLIATSAVAVAFQQLRHAKKAATAQLALDRDTAARQLEQNRLASREQIQQASDAAAQQLENDRRMMNQQLEHAERTALDQSRPYMMVTIEMSQTAFHMLDLVIHNVGAGPAHDVRITANPPLRRARETPGHEIAQARIFQAPIPMIPPGYRMTSFFDSAIDREEARDELPQTHEFTISYNDGRGHDWTETVIVDLSIYDQLLFAETFNVHHVAKALRGIEKHLSKSILTKGPLEVVTEPRADRQARIAEANAEQRRRHEDMVRRVNEARDRPTMDED